MGVYLKDLKMPKSCKECLQEYMFNIFCDMGEDLLDDDGRRPDCPLIEIDLVRCGECKWWNEETHGCNRNPSVKAWWETDYCSYGERK